MIRSLRKKRSQIHFFAILVTEVSEQDFSIFNQNYFKST